VQSELVGKGKLIDEMKLEIIRRAQGVFLWAELVVQILNKDCDRGSVRKIRHRLDEIPNGLDDLFRNILQRSVQEESYLVQILQWILYAARPLTPQEMYLAVHSGTTDSAHVKPWNNEEIEPEAVHRFILNSSKGLAELTKGTKRRKSTVQFIHESVRDYLRRTGFGMLAPNLVEDLAGATHGYLYRCCCQWVSDNVLKHLRLPKTLPKAKSQEAKDIREHATTLFPFLEYSNDNALYHAEMACSYDTTQIDFLKTLPRSPFFTINNVFTVRNTRRRHSMTDILADRGATGLMTRLLLSKRSVAATKSEYEDFEEALRLAKSAKGLTHFIWRADDDDIGRPGASYTAIMHAIDKRNSKVLRTLFRYFTVSLTPMDAAVAFRSRDAKIIEVVLDHPPTFNHLANLFVISTLEQAVRDGDQATLRLFSRHPALRDAGFESNYPLIMQEACKRGYTLVVQSLLEYGIQPGAALPCGSTPLIVAARYGHEAIVRALLLHGTLVDDCDSTKITALCVACRDGKESVVRTLLEHGARVDLACGDTTPLVLAASSGNEAIVGLLLSNGSLGHLRQGVSVDGEKSRQYFKALSTASRNGYDQVVDTLLVYDTAVEIQGAE
jgi:ankyrin repeat protein